MARAAGEPRAVQAAPPIEWVVRVPGSKSLTNRALVLASMAAGRTRLGLALRSQDTDALTEALSRLGVSVRAIEEAPATGDSTGQWPGFEVEGRGGALPGGPDVAVNLGDGGTPTRFVMALAAFACRRVTIDGSARMRERPVADGVELLRALGVPVEWGEAPGRLPVTVDGRAGPPAGGTLRVGPLASSQFVSALLLLAPWMRDGLEVRFDTPPVSRSYIELTIDELRRWGASVHEELDEGVLRAVRVEAGPIPARGEVLVEPDASSALYWAAAAALVPGSDVILDGLPPATRQPDREAIELLGTMGAELVRCPDGLRVCCSRQPRDRAAPIQGVRASAESCPDGALMLIAAAAAAHGPSRFEGLSTLRVKESDRLAAMADGLRRLGAAARIGDDWIEVDPIPDGHRVDAVIDPRRDHRVAMSFAILGLRTGGIRIEDPECVAKSYPRFWDALARCERGSR